MTEDVAPELLAELCADLRLLWTQAGGPSLRRLSLRVELSKSQVGNILNGRIRHPPDWPVMVGLINSFLHYAQEHGRAGQLSVSTAVEQFWRPRYAVAQHACQQTGSRRPVPSAPVAPGPAWMTPHQLPGAVRHFVGRTDELETLSKLVDQSTDMAGTVVISAIDGTAGIGKTALATHWAHLVKDRYPDGQLYVDLRGFDPTGPPTATADVLRDFLDVLGLSREQVPASLQARASAYRSLLFDKRVLVVLDNAHNAEQVRPLLPGSPTALVVVTSRNRLAGLVVTEGATPLTLDLLDAAQARELLARRLGHDRVAAEPDAVDEIIGRCARLPLALTVVAARAAAYPHFRLAALADELRDTGVRLDALNGGDPVTDVRTVFSWSYRRLSSAAARLFRLLGLHPGPDLGVAAAASLAGVPRGTARQLLAELTRAHLVTEHEPGRFALHDLLRAYAVELADTYDSEHERRLALQLILDHYAQGAHAAAALLTPLRESMPLGSPPPAVVWDPISDHRAALNWFATERPVLLAAVIVAAESDFGEAACRLAWAVAGILHLRGQWQDRAAVQRVALAAAQHLAHPAWQARIHRDLAGAYAWLGQFDDSYYHAELALDLYGELGDKVGMARTHRVICLTLERHGRYRQALDHARQSRDLFLTTDDRAGQAYAFNSIGWYNALLGDFPQARDNCEQAVVLLRRIGDRDGEATALDSLGFAHHHLGDHERAIDCYLRALHLFQEVGDRYFEAPTLDHLGDTYYVIGNHDAARDGWLRALTIMEDLHLPETTAIRAKIADLDRTPHRFP